LSRRDLFILAITAGLLSCRPVLAQTPGPPDTQAAPVSSLTNAAQSALPDEA
jgi:hypothetical protein